MKLLSDHFFLPDRYCMESFPVVKDFNLPGFSKTHPGDMIKCLCPTDIEMEDYFETFINRIEQSISLRQHFPVLRISDGELEFLFDRIWLNNREKIPTKFLNFLRFCRDSVLYRGGLNALTIGIYKSGRYSRKEVLELRPKFFKAVIDILGSGNVAFHLNYLSNPFHEQYFPNLDSFLQSIDCNVNTKNSIPFYFVYALFSSGRAKKIFSDKHICLVHSAAPYVRDIIEANLSAALNIGKVSWLSISEERSFYDILSCESIDDYDAIFVGGGIGKANLFHQLSKFSGPIIDAGYFFEVWRDPENRFKRVFCATDDDWISRGVGNVFEAGI